MLRFWTRRGTTVLGGLTLVSLATLVVLGLFVSDPDFQQGDAVRLMYLHVPAAWISYLAYGVTSLASALYLWKRTRAPAWDTLAGASAEIGVLFTGLTLALGSLWGRPVWNVWWAWDARIVSTAVLFFLYLGYLALRRVPAEPAVRARRCSIAALIAFVDVPIVHFSVEWWRTLHQKGTVFNRELNPTIQGNLAWALLSGVVAFTFLYLYLLERRYRLAVLEEAVEGRALDAAIAERRAEAETETGVAVMGATP